MSPWWWPFGWGDTDEDDEDAIEWVAVGWVAHQPEAEMFVDMLRSENVPCVVRRPMGVDVPDMLAGGPRELLVPSQHEELAREMLAPLPPEDQYAPEEEDARGR